jgi:hypothetical protein
MKVNLPIGTSSATLFLRARSANLRERAAVTPTFVFSSYRNCVEMATYIRLRCSD